LCFSFDGYTGARLCQLKAGAKERIENIWLDSFHPSNFPKWGPTGVRTDFPVVEPGLILRVKIELPPLFPPEWERWQLTCWAVMLER
jgi:hypothetical protein